MLHLLLLLILPKTFGQLSDLQVAIIRSECVAFEPCSRVVSHSDEEHFAFIARSVWPFANTVFPNSSVPLNALYMATYTAAMTPRCGHNEQFVEDPTSNTGSGHCVIANVNGIMDADAPTSSTRTTIVVSLVIVLLVILSVQGFFTWVSINNKALRVAKK